MRGKSFVTRLREAADGLSTDVAANYAVKYLHRPMKNHNFVKKLSRPLLESLVPHSGMIQPKPWDHQLACIYLGLQHPGFLFFMDMGGGKSAIALNIIRQRMHLGQIKRTLVLVPNVVTIASWGAEIKKHAPELRMVLMGHNSRTVRQAQLKQVADVWVLNYAGLQSIMTRIEMRKRITDVTMANAVARMFDCVVYDESHKVGNVRTLTYKLCSELSKAIPVRYGMTGTPFGRDPMLLWSQFYLTDRGESLGFKYSLFRDVFFRKEQTPYGPGFRYVFRQHMKADLNRLVQNKAILYSMEECAASLPELVYTIVPLAAPKDMKAHFSRALEEAKSIRKGDYMALKNVFMTMRQIASGFIRLKDVDDETKVDVAFGFNPKLEALRELVDELPQGCKMVVFHDFLYTGKLISGMLTEEKIGHLRLYGGTKDKGTVVDEFNNNPRIKILVTNSASGGTGLNLQVANYIVFFESPVSCITRKQAERRCYRAGQTRTTYMYDLVMEDTWDRRILEYIKEGKDLFEAIVKQGMDAV